MIKHLRIIGFGSILCMIAALAGCSNKTKGVVVASTLPPNASAVTNIIPVLPQPLTTQQFYTVKRDSLLNIVKQEQPLTLVDSLGVAIPSQWVGTVNFGIRKANYVVIHFTGQDSIQQTLRTFSVLSTEVSSHYIVGKDGKIYHVVNDYMRSNHAGVGKWGNVIDMNSCSIGIEIDNNGTEPYTDAEIKSLLALLSYLKKTYNIPTANFIGHQDFAPKRKPDPGPLFPWKLLAEKGFGYWHDDVLEPVPDNFDPMIALRLIGYDISDPNAAIVAFKRHFVQADSNPALSPTDLSVLYNVYKKY